MVFEADHLITFARYNHFDQEDCQTGRNIEQIYSKVPAENL